jgi:hypothetical protein
MATLSPEAIPGLDERQAQALKQAGVDTLEKLAVIDPEAMARQTGLSVNDLRKLKDHAHAAAIKAARPRRVSRSMTIAWVMLALILIAVLAVLYAVRVRQGFGGRYAQAERKLEIACSRVASEALGHVGSASTDAASNNWGQAQNDLNQAGEDITFIEQIAPRSLTRAVQNARSALGSAQNAVGSQDTSTTERIDELRNALDQIATRQGG